MAWLTTEVKEMEQAHSNALRESLYFLQDETHDKSFIYSHEDIRGMVRFIIISGSLNDIKAITSNLDKNWDFLGLACRYNTKEAVEVLATKGFRFCHDLKKHYCSEVALSYATSIEQLKDRFYMFPKVNENEERKRIVEYLLQNQEMTDFKPEWLLFHAMAAGDEFMVDLLQGRGISLDDTARYFFTQSSQSLMKMSDFIHVITNMNPRQKAYVLKTLGSQGDLAFNPGMVKKEEMNNPIILKGILHCRRHQGISLNEFLGILLDTCDMEILNMPELTNWVKDLKELETLEELVNERNDPALSAWFLEYTNNNFDRDKLLSRREKRESQRLNMNFDTQTYQSQFYRLEKGKDGYAILGYKGKDKDVVIPAKISGIPVTCIKEEAFSPCQSRIREETAERRRMIRSITVPEGVKIIEKDCFRRCESLINLTLPHSLEVFECGFPESLHSIVIPENVKAIDYYDITYSKLYRIVFLGNTKIAIGRSEYYNRHHNLSLVKGLKGSDAEMYAKKVGVPFQAIQPGGMK